MKVNKYLQTLFLGDVNLIAKNESVVFLSTHNPIVSPALNAV